MELLRFFLADKVDFEEGWRVPDNGCNHDFGEVIEGEIEDGYYKTRTDTKVCKKCDWSAYRDTYYKK